jgi:cytochrome c biogenesis protein CcmG/thiol:disulfide interchange protein DsbE
MAKAFRQPYMAIGFDQDGRVAIDFGVYGAPETFLIDERGIVIYKHIGILTPEVWQNKFMPLIGGKAGAGP